MKLSVMCAVQKTGFPEYLFDGDFEHAVSQLHGLGIRALELALIDPTALDTVWLCDLLETHEMEVSNIGTGEVASLGFFLTSPDVLDRARCRAELEKHIDIAGSMGTGITVGYIRGPVSGQEFSRREERFLEEELARLCDYAGKKGVPVLLEPLAKKYVSSLNTINEALEMIDRLPGYNLRLLLDSYNMSQMNEDIAGTVSAAGPYIHHVHIADTDRRYPGSGSFDFPLFLDALQRAGYQGYYSLEALPEPDAMTCIRRTKDYFYGLGIITG